MKKVLLGTTAIVAATMITAPTAFAAEKIAMKVGGYYEQWIGYAATDTGSGATTDFDQANMVTDGEIFFSGSTTLDNGVKFGVNVQLEAQTNGDQIDENYMFISGGFGELNLGGENSAMYKMHYAPSDYGIGMNSGDQSMWAGSTAGISNRFRGATGSTYIEPTVAFNDTSKLTYYSPRISGLQFGITWTPDASEDSNGLSDRNSVVQNGLAAAVNFQGDFSGASVKVSAGYGTANTEASTGGVDHDDPEGYNLGVVVGVGGFSFGGSYAQNENGSNGDGEGMNIGVAYSTGPWGVSLAYFGGTQTQNAISNLGANGDHNTIHLSAKYALGPGITLAGTLGYTEFENEDQTLAISSSESTYLVVGIKTSF